MTSDEASKFAQYYARQYLDGNASLEIDNERTSFSGKYEITLLYNYTFASKVKIPLAVNFKSKISGFGVGKIFGVIESISFDSETGTTAILCSKGICILNPIDVIFFNLYILKCDEYKVGVSFRMKKAGKMNGKKMYNLEMEAIKNN